MLKNKFIIEGLGGNKKLKGEIKISGAKNVALKVMASSILFEDEINLEDVPYTEDIKKMASLLESCGAKVSFDKKNHNKLRISTKDLKNTDLTTDLAKAMRASVVLTGPILSRFGRVTFPLPGGCVIGARPVDLFIKAYKKMGAKIIFGKDGNSFEIISPNNKLHGADIFFDFQTVGGTETLMMAAILAKGKTILRNSAMEPEIKSLADYLISCGADIKGAGTPTIEIVGGNLLKNNDETYKTIPDRIEAGSFIILGALLGDGLTIKNCNPEHMESLISILKESGVDMNVKKDSIFFEKNKRNVKNKSFNIRTHEYPGFPTDLQPQIAVYLTQTDGESRVFETIFEGRFKYVEDLIKLGADITIMNEREISIRGGKQLKVSEDDELTAHDIRAGFAVVLAALLAEGRSTVSNIHFIDRGYEKLDEKLKLIGAKIKRV